MAEVGENHWHVIGLALGLEHETENATVSLVLAHVHVVNASVKTLESV